MLFQLSTRFPCSRERVVFQETQNLEISWLLGENLSHLLVLCTGMNLAVAQLREFRFPLCLLSDKSTLHTSVMAPGESMIYRSSYAIKCPLKAEVCVFLNYYAVASRIKLKFMLSMQVSWVINKSQYKD